MNHSRKRLGVTALATTSVVGVVAMVTEPAPVAYATGWCSSLPQSPSGNWPKNIAYGYAATADREHYENSGANTACWYNNNWPDSSWDEGVDCSGFVGKVWGLAPNGGYVNSGGWYSWNVYDTERVIGTSSLWQINTASFGTYSKMGDRKHMDAGVGRNSTGGHVFIVVTPSADGLSDWIIDAASPTMNPQVGFRSKNVNTGYYGVAWEWKYRTNWG